MRKTVNFMKIYEFDQLELSGRRYGGNAGAKTGVIFDDEFWFIKFPKNIRNLNNVQISYTTSPISEYIGSQVYKSIGIPVHETVIGEYKGKIVVACRDFCQKVGERLDEYESIKNDYVEGLEDKISSLSSSGNGSDIEEIKIVMESNELFKQVPELKDRFWDMFVIDALIGNNDRNNGNWGVIVDEDGATKVAPVFDNGNSFSNKLSEQQMERLLNDEQLFIESAYTNRVCHFEKDGKKINPLKYIESRKDQDCNAALLRIVPNIDIAKISEIVNDIPEEYNGKKIIGRSQKKFYNACMSYRYEKVLKPTYQKELYFGNIKTAEMSRTKEFER